MCLVQTVLMKNDFHTIKSILNSPQKAQNSIFSTDFHTIKSILNFDSKKIMFFGYDISILLSLF